MPDLERLIRVDLAPPPPPHRGYGVRVGSGLLDRLGALALESGAARAGSRVFVVCDDGLPAPTVARVQAALAASGLQPILTRARAAESEKTLAVHQRLLVEMAGHRMERLEPVIALGGGIIGDLAGFAAATYRRGVPFIQCPTTLLAMVDASVGGKTGVNLAVGPGDLKKNMAGAFHQPRVVVAEVSVLGSLSDRVFRAGLAECIKHGMIGAEFGDPGLFDWTRQNLGAILRRQPSVLVELIARNVAIKAAVVGRDEREEEPDGGRALLNLGHTFAHAIETLPNLAPDGGPLQHGEAVGLGLIAAARCAVEAGLCGSDLASGTLEAVRLCGLPVAVRALPPTQAVLDSMAHDKKVHAGRLRLILPTAPGRATVIEDPPRPAVIAGIDSIRA